MASGLIERCQEHFGTSDLYAALGVAKNASHSEVKKAYHKLSLKVHPDRAHASDDKELSTKKFQTLSRIYCLLSDKELRAVYDETGDVGDDSSLPENRDWAEYWRLLFGKVTVKQISDFEKEYRGSAAEVEDLKQAYLDAKGSMGKIIDNVLCAKESDEERFRTILDKLIAEDALPKFKSYGQRSTKKQAQRKKWVADEAEEAELVARRIGLSSADGGGSSEGALHALIARNHQSRQARMDSLLSAMEAKYSAAADDDDSGDALDVSARKKKPLPSAEHGKRAARGSTSAKAKRGGSKGAA